METLDVILKGKWLGTRMQVCSGGVMERVSAYQMPDDEIKLVKVGGNQAN